MDNTIRPSVVLVERLLVEIQNSVKTFRPSKSLSMLSGLAEEQEALHRPSAGLFDTD